MSNGFRLGSIIRRWRLSNDLSPAVVAKQIGIAPSTLVHMEQGKMPPHSQTLIAVMNWLLASEEKPNGDQSANEAVSGQGAEGE
jgi:transcriptional regulator with XRE-family HTH domain